MWSKETREQEELTLPNLGPVRGKRESKQKEQPTETQEDEEYLPVNKEPFVPESIHEDRGIPLFLTNPHTTTQNRQPPSIEPKRSTRHRRPAQRLTCSHLGQPSLQTPTSINTLGFNGTQAIPASSYSQYYTYPTPTYIPVFSYHTRH